MRKLILFVATGAGSGYAPVAPGSFGSALGVLLWLPLARLPLAGYLLGLALVSGLGVWVSRF